MTKSASPQAATGRALAIEDYYRIQTVGNPAISPNGLISRSLAPALLDFLQRSLFRSAEPGSPCSKPIPSGGALARVTEEWYSPE